MSVESSADDPTVAILVSTAGHQPEQVTLADEVEIIVVAAADTCDADIAAVVAQLRLQPSLDGVARLVPVTDAMKAVDELGTVTATLDRSRLGHLGPPLAVRRSAFTAALDHRDQARSWDLVALLASRIDRVGVL